MNNRTIFGVSLRLRTVIYHWQESMKCIFHDTEKSPWSAIVHKAIVHEAASVSLKVAWIGVKNTPTDREICYGHDDVIKWKHFSRYWPFVRGIHRSPRKSPHKGQWSGALVFSLIYAWINGWVNNRETDDLRWHRAHYEVTAMARTAITSCPFDLIQ